MELLHPSRVIMTFHGNSALVRHAIIQRILKEDFASWNFIVQLSHLLFE